MAQAPTREDVVNVSKMQFATTIEAPPELVWETFLGAETYGLWTAPFAEGSYFEGTWEEGSRMRFLAPGGDGMLAEIAANREHEFLSIRHIGTVVKGVEDTDSEAVREWAPAFEEYSFQAVAEGTRVVVDQDVAEGSEESMARVWARALDVLRDLCEADSEQ